ncbi:MAG: hypothetical protein DMD37_01215 [Gemmatimonadetes bacterium]|nr:MAG: hypothetical protein DMD74_07740 [Gemmatimonadota bacterium]PYO83621.1 MAG: hypothetical protein DMD68_08880 [Gemmatimonadota bacterium]PYP64799.1 MAG: hypothetical protein DMD37_01215 [Gemmatimonadota bacterium]
MDRGPAVHLFARKGSPLIAQLSLSLRGFVQVRWSERVPAVDRLETGDVFVVDLAELPPHLKPDDVAPVLDHGGLWLVPGGEAVHPSWLELASRSGTRVVPCDAEARSRGVPHLVDALQDALGRQSGRQLSRLVLDQEPVFRPVEPLVELICQHPWRIRRPRDLALHTGMGIGPLKRQLAELGFHRVEHFIVCVRMVAFEQLMAHERLPIAMARWRVGIGDTTNARRQLRRAKKSSKDAFLKLRSLVA